MDQGWELVITFDGKLGEGKAVVQGIEGPACEAVAKWFRETVDLKDERQTPDYHRVARTGQQRRQEARR